MILIFFGDRFEYNLNSFSENENRNDRDVCKKEKWALFTKTQINLLPKIDESRTTAKITNASIIGISENKLGETIFPSE